jgi:hypothetical protein
VQLIDDRVFVPEGFALARCFLVGAYRGLNHSEVSACPPAGLSDDSSLNTCPGRT